MFLKFHRKLLELVNTFMKARKLAYVALRGGENRRARGKPRTLDRRQLNCHMPWSTAVFYHSAFHDHMMFLQP